MEHLYDTHFHLDLQKDRSAVIREIEQNQIYTLAVTNLPNSYDVGLAARGTIYRRGWAGFC